MFELPVVGEADNRGLFRAGYLIVWRPNNAARAPSGICLAAEPTKADSAAFYLASSKSGRTSFDPTNWESSR